MSSQDKKKEKNTLSFIFQR